MGGGTVPAGRVRCASCARVVKGYASTEYPVVAGRVTKTVVVYPHRHLTPVLVLTQDAARRDAHDCPGRYRPAQPLEEART